MNMPFNKPIVFAVAIILIVIAGFVFFRVAGEKTIDESAKVDAEKYSYLTAVELNQSTTSTESIRRFLEESFRARRLKEIETFSLDGTDRGVTLASPVLTSEGEETGECVFQDNPYCGLYVTDANGSRLVLFGSDLDGFKKIERMIDDTHVRILTQWSMLNFESIDRSSLDLETGEVEPILVIEVDQDFNSASITIAEENETTMLSIEGTTEASRLVPRRVTLKDEGGNVASVLSEQDVLALHNKLELDAERTLKAIHVAPSDDDADLRIIHVELYGVPLAIDLEKHLLIRD